MTLKQMAQRVIQAQAEGDLRFDEFITRLAERLGISKEEAMHRTFLLAMGISF